MQTITVDALRALRAQDRAINVINVLDRKAFHDAHIPGSINIPVGLDDFVSRVEARVAQKDEPVVVYCASEECEASPTAGRALEEAGFTSVLDFEGGMRSWQDAGQPVEQGV